MLYLLCGPDTFRSRQKLHEIIARAESVHKDKLSLRKIDLAEENISVFERELETASLFTPLRFVVLRNASLDKEIGKKVELLIKKHDLTASKEAIIVFYEESLDSKDPLLSLIEKNGKVQQFNLLSKGKIISWITNFFLNRKIKIDIEAINILAQSTGSDLWRLNNECEKLAAWAVYPKQLINAENVLNIVNFDSESNIFAMVDGIINKNPFKATRELEALLIKGEDVNGLFYLLVKQFQSFSQIFALAQKGSLPANTAKIVNVHPYVATKLSSSLHKWPEKELKRFFDKLAAFDLAIKTGTIETRLALTLLTSNLD